jgi:hypothetical protein
MDHPYSPRYRVHQQVTWGRLMGNIEGLIINTRWRTPNGIEAVLNPEHGQWIISFGRSQNAVIIQLGTTGEKGSHTNFRCWNSKGEKTDYLGSTRSDGNFKVSSSTFSSEHLCPFWVAGVEWLGFPDQQELQKLEEEESGPPKGPPPSMNGKKAAEPPTDPTAYTYALRYGDHGVYKLGWASDPKARLTTINKHIPIEIPGHQRWEIVRLQKWETRLEAYSMEQALLKQLKAGEGERVSCEFATLICCWDEFIGNNSNGSGL